GRFGLEYRLALETGAHHRTVEGRAAGDPGEGPGAEPERGDPASAADVRCTVPIQAGAVERGPDRASGQGSGAGLGPTRIPHPGSPQARARTACLVQSLSRSPSLR